jgi:hypothetical protein
MNMNRSTKRDDSFWRDTLSRSRIGRKEMRVKAIENSLIFIFDY